MPNEMGSLHQGRIPPDMALAAGAFWYDMHLLDISGEAGDIICPTEYPGETVSALGNNHATNVLAVKVQTMTNAGAGGSDVITLSIGPASILGRVPPIYKIVQSGTGDGLILFTHKT